MVLNRKRRLVASTLAYVVGLGIGSCFVSEIKTGTYLSLLLRTTTENDCQQGLQGSFVSLQSPEETGLGSHRSSAAETLVLHRARTDLLFLPETPDPVVEQNVKNAIGSDEANSTSPLQQCNATCQVVIDPHATPWKMYTIDLAGNLKSVGGDEFYVSFTDAAVEGIHPSSAVARVNDHGNGTYSLSFVSNPMIPTPTPPLLGYGNLEIFFQYTCGIGRLDPPVKFAWDNSGNSRTVYRAMNVSAPPIHVFQPPSLQPDFSAFDSIISFGDSLQQELFATRIYTPNLKPRRSNIYVCPNPNHNLSTNTTPSMLELLQKCLNAELPKAGPKVALVLGSAAWDILLFFKDRSSAWNRTDHLLACRLYVQQVRELYPNVTVFWQSPQALHVHRPLPSCYTKRACRNRIQYMSTSRMESLYHEQKAIMKDLNVPMLDLYEASYVTAHYTPAGDGVHHAPIAPLSLSWFFTKTQRRQSRSRPMNRRRREA